MDDDGGDEHRQRLQGVEPGELGDVHGEGRDREQAGPDPGGEIARLAPEPDEHDHDQQGHGDQGRYPRRGEALPEQVERLRHEPGVEVDPGVDALGDARLAGGEQALGRQDVIILVGMRHPPEIDRVKQSACDKQNERRDPARAWP
jgi:hypothetical protein